MNWHQIRWRFYEITAHAAAPYEFPRALIARLDQEPNEQKKEALYELACVIVMNTGPNLSSVTLEELWDLSEANPVFGPALERASKSDVEEWRRDAAKRKKERDEEQETRQARNIENLIDHKANIESGSDVGILIHYAQVWFGQFTDVDKDATPSERLRSEVGSELAESIEVGFRNTLQMKKNQTLVDIAELSVDNRSYRFGYVVLAAMDIEANNGMATILNLPHDVLSLAIAYDMANIVERRAEWPTWLMTENPVLFAQILDQYWRAQLNLNPERITNFYAFRGDEPLLPFVVQILPGLLRDFSKTQPLLLEAMLVNAVRFCSHDVLQPLVTNALTQRFTAGSGQRSMWLAAGFVIKQNNLLGVLTQHLRRNNQDKWSARPILMANVWNTDDQGKLTASISYRKQVVEILGSTFNNVHHERGGGARWVSNQDEPTAADEIRRLIHTFSQDSSDETAAMLTDLATNPTLSQWYSDLFYTIANQVRTAREARFTYSDVSQVVSTLSNAEPANVADLRALVMEALNEVADDIRHGNTDGYKSFWNIGLHSKATDQHIDENTARDRLLELLRPKLRHLDIAAEPEGRFADDKRADIVIYCRGMKLPIEIKRDDHKEIWEAAKNQLMQLYARDPASEGNGIYLAFWFDGKGMKAPPKGIMKPANAEELQTALQTTIPETSVGLIDVVVVDASVPEDKKATASTRKAKSGASGSKKKAKKK